MATDLLLILCTSCSESGEPLYIRREDAVAICPRCKSRFLVLSGHVVDVASRALRGNGYRYRIEIASISGKRCRYRADCGTGLSLRAGSSVTLVSQGVNPIGIIDHTREMWYRLHHAHSLPRLPGRFARFLTLAIFLTVIVQVGRYMASLASYGPELWGIAGGQLAIATVAALAVLAEQKLYS